MLNELSVIELDQSNFNYNIANLSKIKNSEQLAIVLKSNAYGHGLEQISKLAQENNDINWLCVAGLSEAVQLRNFGITKPILVMSYLDDNLEYAAQLNISCAVYSILDAQALSQAAVKLNKKISVHIKIDTGMGRLGILPQETINFIRTISKLNLNIEGIFTHLSHSAQPDSNYNYKQLECFDNVLLALENANIKIKYTHALSSSSLHLNLKSKNRYSFIRAGALSYGLIKNSEHYNAILKNNNNFDIKPILCWKTKIVSLKTVPDNWLIGYDGRYKAQNNCKLAVLPVGYFDGYNRNLSNSGVVLVESNGKLEKANICGTISMNLTTIDVSNIADIKVGDTVKLLGSEREIRPDTCAKQAGLITNEFIVNLNPNIKRKIINLSLNN